MIRSSIVDYSSPLNYMKKKGGKAGDLCVVDLG